MRSANSVASCGSVQLSETRQSPSLNTGGGSSSGSPAGSSGRSAVRGFLATPLVSSFIAGGCAGALSRTVVSPFERMKILFQVQGPGQQAYRGVWPTLVKMWREEGWRGFMRGNGINCVRIFPYSAVQFCTYTLLKQRMAQDGELTALPKLVAGSLAGVVSVVATYPLDLVRTRLSIQTASIGHLQQQYLAKPPGMFATLKHIVKTEGGVLALWRGLIPTTLGVAPYVGLNFVFYEWIRDRFTPGGTLPTWGTLLAGAVSGGAAQTITYPFDLLRRRFQVKAMGELQFEYSSTWNALSSIVQREGVRGLFKGLGPNLLKVVPCMATTFWTFETVKQLIASSSARL